MNPRGRCSLVGRFYMLRWRRDEPARRCRPWIGRQPRENLPTAASRRGNRCVPSQADRCPASGCFTRWSRSGPEQQSESRAAVGIPVAGQLPTGATGSQEAAMSGPSSTRHPQIPSDAVRALRARLAAGTLVRARGGCCIQSASGKNNCAVCGLAIRARMPECEVMDRVRLHAHLPCFKLWVEESRAHEAGAGRARGTDRRKASAAHTRWFGGAG